MGEGMGQTPCLPLVMARHASYLWEYTQLANTGCQRGIRSTLSQRPVYRTHTELLPKIEIKFAIVPSLRNISAPVRRRQLNNTSVALAFSA